MTDDNTLGNSADSSDIALSRPGKEPEKAAIHSETDRQKRRERQKLTLEKLRKGTIDRRLKEFKDAQRIREQIYEDLGGEAGLSETQKIIVERIVFKTIWARMLEIGAISSDDPEIALLAADRYYLAIVNSLRRDLTTIGLKRVSRAETLDSYLEKKKAEVIEVEPIRKK